MTATLYSLLQVARHEFRMTLRGRAGWGSIAAACLLAFIDAATKEHSPLVAGLRASMFGCTLLLAPLSLVFVAGAARRDDTVGAGDVIDSRPFPGYLLIPARLLGNLAVALLGYVLVIIVTLAVPLIFAGRFPSPWSAVHAFTRGIVPLLYIVTLAYCGVSLARNVLAAAVVAVYWLFVLLWGDFLARVFNFSLTQNWPTYTAMALGVLLLTMALRRRIDSRGQGLPGNPLLATAAAAFLLFGPLNAWQRVAWSHDKPLRHDPLAMEMGFQHRETCERVPGWWLPDQRGNLHRTSDEDGKALVVGLWSPHEPESMELLDVMQKLVENAPEGSVECVAICLADDHALSRHVAREAGYDFVMVTDTGTHYSPKIEDCGPLPEAYQATALPKLFIADRGHRITVEFSYQLTLGHAEVQAALEQALNTPVPPGVGVDRS